MFRDFSSIDDPAPSWRREPLSDFSGRLDLSSQVCVALNIRLVAATQAELLGVHLELGEQSNDAETRRPWRNSDHRKFVTRAHTAYPRAEFIGLIDKRSLIRARRWISLPPTIFAQQLIAGIRTCLTECWPPSGAFLWFATLLRLRSVPCEPLIAVKDDRAGEIEAFLQGLSISRRTLSLRIVSIKGCFERGLGRGPFTARMRKFGLGQPCARSCQYAGRRCRREVIMR